MSVWQLWIVLRAASPVLPSQVVASQRAPIGKAEAATQTPTQLYLSAVDAAGDLSEMGDRGRGSGGRGGRIS